MDEIELRFDAASIWLELAGYFSLIIIGIAVVELIWDLYTRNKTSLRETGANVAIGAGNELLGRTVAGSTFVIALLFIEPFSPGKLPMNGYTWGLVILLTDLTYYWMHRLEHEVRLLWSFHSVHHSSSEFDLTTALRLAWIEGTVEWIFFVPLVWLGFDVVQVVSGIAVVVAYQSWIHTEKIATLGWLDRVFNTPSVHRVHHGVNPQYIDKNYGGILIIWDRIFGTYACEQEQVVYGITTPIGSSNPVVINFHEIVSIARDLIGARNLSEAWHYLFDRPGWSPERSTIIVSKRN